jgi:hypothetical protein
MSENRNSRFLDAKLCYVTKQIIFKKERKKNNCWVISVGSVYFYQMGRDILFFLVKGKKIKN